MIDLSLAERRIDIGYFGYRDFIRRCGVDGLKYLPGIVLPASITRDAPCVEDTFDAFRPEFPSEFFDKVAVFRRILATSVIDIIVLVVGEVGRVIPCEFCRESERSCERESIVTYVADQYL